MPKLLLSMLFLLAMPLSALAAESAAGRADDGWSDTPVAASNYVQAAEGVAETQAEDARDCCHEILERCHTVTPKCIWRAHKCATPFLPCAPQLPCLSACHKPVTPYTPCAPCLPELCTCHKPAVAVKPEVCCDCEVKLTGSRELIADTAGCECGCHADGNEEEATVHAEEGWGD